MANQEKDKVDSIEKSVPLKSQIRYMGFGWRMIAQMIDIFVVCFVLFPLVPVFNQFYYDPEVLRIIQTPELQQTLSVPEAFLMVLPGIIFQYFILSLYILGCWILWGATLGKRLLSMKIVDAKTGEKPTVSQFIMRFLGYALSMLPIGLGFIAIHYSRKKQGWHDMLSGTAVVECRSHRMQESSPAAKEEPVKE